MLTDAFVNYFHSLLREVKESKFTDSNFLNLNRIEQILNSDFEMDFSSDRVLLKDRSQPNQGLLSVNFLEKSFQNRIRNIGGEYFIRVFARKRGDQQVFDSTAGFGKDLVVALACGFKVVACEQNPVVYLLLQDGLRRLFREKEFAQWSKNLQLFCSDSIRFLDLAAPKKFDVIYLDPLFAQKPSRSHKEIEAIKKICPRQSPNELFKKALSCAKDRVVVKQHLKSPYLMSEPPSFVKRGKSFRFDVYLSGKIG